MNRLVDTVALIAVLAALSGCASASAKGRPKDAPALNVPPPPPRIIEPAPEPMPEPVSELPVTPPPTTPAESKKPRPRDTSRAPASDPKASDPKPVEQPPPDPAPVPQPPTQPPAQLRTPQTPDAENATRTIRTTIERTNSLLSNINYQSLTQVRQKAYNDVQRLIKEAEEALKQANYMFAQAVATKAETLAKELSGK